MKRLLTLITACVLAVVLASPVNAIRPAFVDSVRPLQALLPKVVMTPFGPMEDPSGDRSIRRICTTTSINEQAHLWITAAHCVGNLTKHEIDSNPRFIDDQPADVIAITYVTDMAILHTPDYSLPDVKLSKMPPSWLDKVIVAGHPWGLKPIFVVPGQVVNPLAWIDEEDTQPYLLLSAPVAGGNSGSCVFNTRGEVISILQIGFGSGFAPVSGGAPYVSLRQFAAKYFSR